MSTSRSMPNTAPSLASSSSDQSATDASKKRKIVHVAVAVIERDGRFFLAKRPDDTHQGGLWEFPGGKVEPGECVLDALARELDEELAITLGASDLELATPLIVIEHDYGDKVVCLDVWKVLSFKGEPSGNEGQQTAWFDASELKNLAFPAANKPIVDACLLPETIAITPKCQTLGELQEFVDLALEKGAGAVLFRQPDLPFELYCDWARQILELFPNLDLILHGDPDRFLSFEGVPVHMTSNIAKSYSTRAESWSSEVSVSCHNLDEIKHASHLGARFCFLSPVKETTSHPGAKTLGWKNFGEFSRWATIPVYALGGLGLEDVKTAQTHGAQGIAAISSWVTDV